MTNPPQQPENQRPENQPGNQPPPGYGPAPQPGATPQPGPGAPPPGYGAPQQGYGSPPQQGYGAPPQQGYGAPEPKKRRTGLIIGIAVAVVLVLVVGGVLVATLSGSDSSSPRSAADTFIGAIKSQDVSQAQSVTCAAERDKLATSDNFKIPDDYTLSKFEYTFDKDTTKPNGDHELTYKVDATIAHNGKTKDQKSTFTFTTVDESNTWKVCDFNTD